jgi:phosphopantothenoylcysteine decarboxylase/phosphopantothenate--cysteine ligase
MDLDMYAHGSTQQNIEAITALGCTVIGPSSGPLASGLSGEGRMTEPDEIRDFLVTALSPAPLIEGKKILVTAGPTREPIDPVRFLSNRSSGKMGVAIARELAARGGEVTLIAGPGVKVPAVKNIAVITVNTAAEMYEACMKHFPGSIITVMAAAVADFTPGEYSGTKIKKKNALESIHLVPTRDILGAMGEARSTGQLIVGFALETDNELENARGKLKSKNLDLIVLNSLNDTGAGFDTDTNKITLIDKNNQVTSYGLKPKTAAARDIADKITSLLENS